MIEYFYDIESLHNAFTLCNFKANENAVDVYYLCDTKAILNVPDFETKLIETIYDRNVNFKGSVTFHNLETAQACSHMAKTFGVSDAYKVTTKNSKSNYPVEFRPVCTTDPEYDENKHPYIFGYNSYQYDTSMLAQFFFDVFFYNVKDNTYRFTPTTAKKMREFNDTLFTERFKKFMPNALKTTYDPISKFWTKDSYDDSRHRIRSNMLLTGRHIDIAKLNEKQYKVGLKRLLGMLGYQILESDKLKNGIVENFDEFAELIAYNVSDVVNLKELFHHKYYKAQFELKKDLLDTYKELIYEQDGTTYKPKCDPDYVRWDRLNIDSTSAQFAAKALCPYGHLKDIQTVSYNYPDTKMIEELAEKGIHIKQINVLEETKKFFFEKFPNNKDLQQQFMKVYNYYKNIEGKNFNDSQNYIDDYGDIHGNLPEHLKTHTLSEIKKDDCCMPYFNKDGTPSTCFVKFSVGGIHGAEYNKIKFDCDTLVWMFEKTLFDKVKEKYPDPLELRQAKTVTINDITYSYKRFLISKTTIKAMEKTPAHKRANLFYKNIDSEKPVLFNKKTDGSTELNKKYVYTSAGLSNHEDFFSYYPFLLIMLNAYFNKGLGYNRYVEISDNKTLYGKLMKNLKFTKTERIQFSIKRAGTKLVLNATTGGSDTKGKTKSPIQMNNRIISMRIIGQLFTYRIGQAQTIEGAKIVSTNTDGLYSIMDAELNNKILKRESKNINVEIEPESIYLISKDTNNRLDMNHITGAIESASGGSLACREDTDPTKALDHPAILDWALAEYLIVAATGYKSLSLSKPFDRTIGASILNSAKEKFSKTHLIRMFQNILASSNGSMTYIFGMKGENPTPHILQHYNRAFIVKDNGEDTYQLQNATAKAITDSMKNKRKRKDERAVQHDLLALQVLGGNDIKPTDIPKNKEATITKITNIDTSWNMLIENKAINFMTDAELDAIYNRLDMDKYLELLENTYEKNWKNDIPEITITQDNIDALKLANVA